MVQAQWTHELRKYIFKRLRLTANERILEIGSGTGAILSELYGTTPTQIFGLDINLPYLRFSRKILTTAHLIQGNGFRLPFRGASFYVTYCHYLLLWIKDPAAILSEMVRVTKPGGWVLALAEPDYGGRIDYPQELEILGRWQASCLSQEGANIEAGRQLSALFYQTGLHEVEVGVFGARWSAPLTDQAWESEWQMLTYDLSLANPPLVEIDSLRKMQEIDRLAWANGQRILFVPTFYACGRVLTNTRLV